MVGWIGNESYVKDERDKIIGVYTALGPALHHLAAIGAAGSEAALITYGGKRPVIRRPFSDLASFDATSLGSQQEYSNNNLPLLRASLITAGNELHARTAKRRILVVFNDGTDVDDRNDAAIDDEINAISRDGVEIYTVCIPVDEQARCDRMKTMGKNGSFTVSTVGELDPITIQLVTRIKAGPQPR